jgi:hypothetical protein
VANVEAYSAGADDGDALARLRAPGQQLRIADGLGMVDAVDLRHARPHAARQHDLVELAVPSMAASAFRLSSRRTPRELDAPREVAQRVAEIFLARYLARVAELPANFVAPSNKRHAMAALGERRCAGQSRGSGAHHGDALGVAAGARINSVSYAARGFTRQVARLFSNTRSRHPGCRRCRY